MAAQNAGSLKITAAGTTTRVTTSPVKIPVPPNGNSGNPRFVRLLTDNGTCYVVVGGGGSLTAVATFTASINGLLINATVPGVLDVKGLTMIKAICRQGTAHLNVAPIDE